MNTTKSLTPIPASRSTDILCLLAILAFFAFAGYMAYRYFTVRNAHFQDPTFQSLDANAPPPQWNVH